MNILLLNKDESVISVIDWKYAVLMHFQGKVTNPYSFEDYIDIKMVDSVYRLPSAVILKSYVQVPHKIAPLTKKNVMYRDDFTCAYCGRTVNSTTGSIDHIIPLSRWHSFKKNDKSLKGNVPNNWHNVITACKSCNHRKADKTPSEAGMQLSKKPYAPTRSVLNRSLMKKNESWLRWIR